MNTDISSSGTELTGQLLLAMPGLPDPNFSGTVTLICEHGGQGAMGLVINHPTEIRLADIFEQLDIPWDEARGRAPVLSGGPVGLERGFVLHRAEAGHWEASIQVTPEIALTASRDVIQAMASPDGLEPSLLILGYAGWGPGQLEAEILENSWLTIPASSEIVFDTPFAERLRKAAASAGIDYSRLSGGAGRA